MFRILVFFFFFFFFFFFGIRVFQVLRAQGF